MGIGRAEVWQHLEMRKQFSCSPVAVGSSLVGVDGLPVGSNHPLQRSVRVRSRDIRKRLG